MIPCETKGRIARRVPSHQVGWVPRVCVCLCAFVCVCVGRHMGHMVASSVGKHHFTFRQGYQPFQSSVYGLPSGVGFGAMPSQQHFGSGLQGLPMQPLSYQPFLSGLGQSYGQPQFGSGQQGFGGASGGMGLQGQQGQQWPQGRVEWAPRGENVCFFFFFFFF